MTWFSSENFEKKKKSAWLAWLVPTQPTVSPPFLTLALATTKQTNCNLFLEYKDGILLTGGRDKETFYFLNVGRCVGFYFAQSFRFSLSC